MAAFESTLVPQKSLAAVRRVLEARARGLRDTEAEVAADLSARHATYALAAAAALGAVTPEGELTAGGAAIVAAPPGSEDERLAIRRLLVTSDLFREVVPELLEDVAPNRAVLAARIHRLTGLSPATADRRAHELLGWRRTLLATSALPAEQLRLPHVRVDLPADTVRAVESANPWWAGEPMRAIKPFRRSFVAVAWQRMHQNAAAIVVIKGPRQVGKSVAQEQLIADLLASGVHPRRVLRMQFDDLPVLRGLSSQPILDVVRWYERTVLQRTLNTAARAGEPAFLFVDEAQNVPDWSVQLKSLVDLSDLKVVLTGSSALRIQASADSLAGRTTTIEVPPLSVVEIAALRGFGSLEALLVNGPGPMKSEEAWHALVSLGERQAPLRDRAADAYLERGGYPRCHLDDEATWDEIAPALREDIIQKAITHDARIGPRGTGKSRRVDLLAGVFREACRNAGRAISNEAMASSLSAQGVAGVKPDRVREYLDWFEGALLVRLVRPVEAGGRKIKGIRKICLVDPGLRAAFLSDHVPLSPRLLADAHEEIATQAGVLVESIVGAWLGRLQGTDVQWFPARGDEGEVDFVLVIGDQRIPVEVKYKKRLKAGDLDAIERFIARPAHNAPFGVVITQTPQAVTRPHIVAVPLASLFLLTR